MKIFKSIKIKNKIDLEIDEEKGIITKIEFLGETYNLNMIRLLSESQRNIINELLFELSLQLKDDDNLQAIILQTNMVINGFTKNESYDYQDDIVKKYKKIIKHSHNTVPGKIYYSDNTSSSVTWKTWS